MTTGVSVLPHLRGLVWSVMTSLVLMTTPGVLTFPRGVAPESPQKPETILLAYHVDSDIHYRYATTLISSKVLNPTDRKQRVNFTVVIPENAYITSFLMEVGGQLYRTEVTERTQPDGRLNEIEAVRLRDSNVFRASVCLAPGGTRASFYLSYEELLQRRLGAYEYVVNLHPGQIAKEMRVHVAIHEERNISALRVPSIRSGHEIDQDPHDTDDLIEVMQTSPTEAHIRLNPTPEQQEKWKGKWKQTKSQKNRLADRGGGRFMKRGVEGQLVVLYDVARDPYDIEEAGGEVLVKGGYFVHFFSPASLPTFSRHLVFVIDVSETMSGQKMRHLKKALTYILDSLKRTDYFSIIKFNNKKSVWSPYRKKLRRCEAGGGRIVPATSKYLAKAKKHLKKLSPSGGTKTLRGLLKGLSVARESQKLGGNSTLFPIIVLVTDGENDTEASDIESEGLNAGSLSGQWEIPIFCLGYVPDSDVPLLRAISRRSAGGSTRRIYNAADAEFQISELLAASTCPVLGGIRFTYLNNPGGLEVDPVTLTQSRFYTAVSGSELVVAGRLKGHFKGSKDANHDPNLDSELIGDAATLTGFVTAMSAKGKARFKFRSTTPTAPYPLESLWAYLMLSQLTSLEAAQKAWGTYWTEKSLNGVNTSTIKQPATPRWKDKDLAHDISSLVTSAELMAKHYSFVSPGMTLKFYEIKDEPWEYDGALCNSSFDGSPDWKERCIPQGRHWRQRRHVKSPGGPRGVKEGHEVGHGLGRMKHEDSEHGGGCNGEKEGIFWSAFPHKPRPSSLCQIGIHNLTCPGDTSDSGHKKYPLLKSVTDLTWMKDVKRGSDLVLPKGYHKSESLFQLGLGQEDKLFGKCRTPSGVPGHCRHLIFCLLKDFATDYNYFLKFFCHIEGSPSYVGVCCPDYLYKNKKYHG